MSALLTATVEWLKSLPAWGKGVALGGALVFVSLSTVMWVNPGPAVAANAAAIQRNEIKVESQQTQLDRMEKKLDQLLLKLIPNPK